jgi:hypothetical protein
MVPVRRDHPSRGGIVLVGLLVSIGLGCVAAVIWPHVALSLVYSADSPPALWLLRLLVVSSLFAVLMTRRRRQRGRTEAARANQP